MFGYLFYISSVVLMVVVSAAGCVGSRDDVERSAPAASSPELSGFCGFSTEGECNTDDDCMTGGCSGQVCQSKAEDGIITTCEWRECYDESRYGIECGCVEGKCVWHKQ